MSKDIFYTQLEQLVEAGNTTEVLALLKNTPTEERLKYTKKISKLGKYYQEYVPEESNRTVYGYRGNDEQRSAISFAVLASCVYRDFKGIWFIGESEFNDILEWYIPDWLGEYVNDRAAEGWIRAPFNEIVYVYELNEKGGFKTPLTERTWATIMVSFSNVELFDKYPALLEKQFWYLFDHEVSINYNSWDEVIATLIAQGRLDKHRIVQTAVQSALTHTNQALSGWNANLLGKIGLTDQDIVAFQEDIFQLLNSPLSKVANEALDTLFKIAKEKAFHTETFISHLPILMSSTVKATINKVLRIVATFDRSHPTYKEASAGALVGAFHIQDQTLQTKIAKQIIKYAKPNEDLNAQLTAYQDMMMSETKTLLGDYITAEVIVLGEMLEEGEVELMPVVPIATVEELIFHCSSIWSTENNFVFEQTVDAVVRLSPEIRSVHIEQLLPAFDKAYKKIKDIWSGTPKQNVVAFWMLEWSRMLMADTAIDTIALEKIYVKHSKEELYSHSKTSLADVKLEPSNRFKYYYSAMRPYLTIYFYSLQLLKEKRQFPILSLHTHEPFYINAVELVDRLTVYQKQGELIDALDFQIALARINTVTFAEGLTHAKKVLKGELLAIMEFYLGDGVIKEESETYYDVWRLAAALKYPHDAIESLANDRYTKEQQLYCAGWLGSWEVIEDSHTYEDWDRTTKKKIEKVFTHKKLKLEQIPYEINTSVLFSRVNKGMPKTAVGERMGSVNLMELIKYQIMDVSISELSGVMAIIPKHLDAILMAIVERCLHYGGSATFEVAEKKALQEVFTYLLQMNKVVFTDQFYLFYGLSMMADDKVTRSFAAEYWIKEALHLDQKRLGHVIGKALAKEYVTIKRLTDSIQSFMMNVSVQHNQALQELIEAILCEMNETPIKGFKSLLEQYVEVLSTNQVKVTNDRVIELAKAWSKVTTTKKAATLIG